MRAGHDQEGQHPTGPPRPRVALYSHDTMGIGHVRRNLLIAQVLASPPVGATVLLIAGAREATSFAVPPGVDCLTLPALYKTPEGRYRSRSLDVPLPHLVSVRARTIEAALTAFQPDVLIVDKEPLGAVRELEPALRAVRDRGETRCVLGLRDVLDDPAAVRREWGAAGNAAAVREFYHAVWVYGDPGVYDVVRECRLGPALRGKVTYTGYLDACHRLGGGEPEPPANPYVLCMVGGGQDGAKVAEAFAHADRPAGLDGVLVTGPYLPADARERLHRRAADTPRLRVTEFDREPCRLLQRAERVVAMGGYNTVCEVLAFEKRALIVPRVTPRREQFIRAQRLRDLGLLDLLHPDDVTPAAVSRWLASGSAAVRSARTCVDLRGTARIPLLLNELLGRPTTPTPTPAEASRAAP